MNAHQDVSPDPSPAGLQVVKPLAIDAVIIRPGNTANHAQDAAHDDPAPALKDDEPLSGQSILELLASIDPDTFSIY